ncbi:MAG: hypothetical protein Q7K41_06175, partial [Dehalococcoidales bacterium]|nr:hypothetical protein [Dehalococcoidales bacterium]
MAVSAQEVGGAIPSGFGIYFNSASPNSYIIFADNGDHIWESGESLETIQLESNIKISGLAPAGSFSVVFTPPDPTVWVNGVSSGPTAQINLAVKDGSAGNQAISVNNSGLVAISNLPPPTTADTTPPTRSSGSPTGTLAAGTTNTNISLTTNESATCKYSTTAGTAYGSMANTFTTTGSVSHSTNITGLTDGSPYNYYVRCQDAASNQNTNDFAISFSVASPANIFGLNSGDATEPAQGANALQAMRFQNTAGTGSITKLELLIDDTTSPAGNVRMGVYADSSGYPGALLLDAGAAAITATGWVSISGLSWPVTANSYYWLSFNMDSANGIKYQTGQPLNSHYRIDPPGAPYGPLPLTFPAGAAGNNLQFVMRATV